MREQMDKLGRILRDQQKLMEQTFKLDQAMRDRMQSGDPNEDGDDPLNQPMPGLNDQMQPNQGQQDQGQQDQQQQDQQQGQKQQGDSQTDNMTADQLRDALKQLRKQQDELGKQLGELQKSLGEMGMKPNQNYGKAQREMGGASGELGKGNGEGAVQGQGRALEALRQGTREMMNQLMAQSQQQPGQGQQSGQGSGNQNGRDPLGRDRNPGGPTSEENGVKIPDIIDAQRARDILNAIRERLSNNPSLSEERRYLERLLDIQ